MPQGIQVFDTAGNVIVDTSDRLARFIGGFYMNNASVTVNSPAINRGTPFQVCCLNTQNGNGAPTMTVGNGTITFSPATTKNGTIGYIYFGVF